MHACHDLPRTIHANGAVLPQQPESLGRRDPQAVRHCTTRVSEYLHFLLTGLFHVVVTMLAFWCHKTSMGRWVMWENWHSGPLPISTKRIIGLSHAHWRTEASPNDFHPDHVLHYSMLVTPASFSFQSPHTTLCPPQLHTPREPCGCNTCRTTVSLVLYWMLVQASGRTWMKLVH